MSLQQRLYPMQHTAAGTLGPIHLFGYDINTTSPAPGSDLVFRHYWQAELPTESIHHVYNHLLNTDGKIVAQVDYVPLWDDSDETLLGREFTLSLPADLPTGDYALVTGFYDPQTGERLTSADGADSITIATLTVVRADP